MLQEFLSFIFAWYNLPFTILLGIGMLLAGLQLVGLGGGDDSDSAMEHDVAVDHSIDLDHSVDLEHDIAIDHDVDIHHDIDMEHAGDVDHAIDHDADASVEHEAGAAESGGSALTLLAFLGVGKTPLMVVLLIVFTLVGMFGWMLNNLALAIFGSYPGLLVLLTLPLALVGGSLVTSRITRFIGNLLPPISTTVSRAKALVGLHGTVISPFVDAKYGMVHLRDPGGTLISVFAVTRDTEPVKRGDDVILLAYDLEKRVYLVTRSIQPVQ